MDYYNPDVINANDYYPGGMQMPERRYVNGSGYRYGFGGQEGSDEIKGFGNSYTAEYWEYDPRLGRRWNVDPIVKEWESPYAALGNNPILLLDPDGADAGKKAKKQAEKYQEQYGNNKEFSVLIENTNEGNIRVMAQWYDPEGNLVNSGKIIERSWLGRKLNMAKQFGEGFVEGTVELGKFAINIFNPDLEKNSLYQTGKFLVNAVVHPINTFNNIKDAVKSINWSDPSTYGKGLSMIVVPAAGAKLLSYASKAILSGRSAAALVEGVEATSTVQTPINITAKGLFHVMDRHTINEIAKWAGKSKFADPNEVINLIQNSANNTIIRQANGNFVRIVDAGKVIGLDATTGQSTSIYSVVTKPSGELVTAFPGKPLGY